MHLKLSWKLDTLHAEFKGYAERMVRSRTRKSIEICQKNLRISFQPFSWLLTSHLSAAAVVQYHVIGPIDCSTPERVWHKCILCYTAWIIWERIRNCRFIIFFITITIFFLCIVHVLHKLFSSKTFTKWWEQNQVWKKQWQNMYHRKWRLYALLNNFFFFFLVYLLFSILLEEFL